MKRFLILVIVLLLMSGGSIAQQAQPSPRTPTFSPDDDQTVMSRDAAGDALAAAMDIPASQIINASIGGSDPKGVRVFEAAFSGFPTQGSSFAVISTGKAKDAPTPNTVENLSTVLDGLKTTQEEDLVQLTLRLNVPTNATFWAVDFKFFSEEYEEYVGSSYNDAFFIETPNSTFVINEDNTVEAPNNVAFDPAGNLVTINSTGPTGMSRANAAGTTYDGATKILTAYAPIPAGSTEVKIVFSVMDVGDSIYDTAAFLDNFRFLFGDVGPGDSNPPVFDVPPTPANGTVFEVEVGQPLSINLQATDPDAGDTVTIDLLEDVTGASVTSSAANPGTGTFNWTPAAGQEGVYVIPFIATDNNGAASSPHSLVVTVGNIPPEAVDDKYVGSANFVLNEFAPGVLENDTDVNSDDILTVNTTPVEAPRNGSVVLNADGSFEYTPNTNFTGVDVFTYEVSDGEFTDTAEVFLTIGSNLLINGGFETEGFTKQDAAGWKRKNPAGAARTCDKPLKEKEVALSGQCAVVFTGGAASSLGQNVTVIGADSATQLYLTSWVTTEALTAAGKIKIVAKHTNDTKDKVTLDIPAGSAAYSPLNGQIALTGEPAKLKVKISIGAGSGKFTIDDVFLSLAGESTATSNADGTIALPEAGASGRGTSGQ